MSTLSRENKMGTMPVGKLLASMSVPMIISMLVQALYNIVDSIFVAKIGESALSALSLAFPLQNMMIAVSVGTGVGINSLLSRFLGQKDFESANRTAVNGVFLAVCSSLLFVLVGLFAVKPFFAAQTKDQQIIDYGVEYLSVCCTVSFGLFLSVTFERLLQSTGRTFFSMLSQLLGAITNIVLDPILIFGYFGIPPMGVRGAAIATVIGQIAGAVLAILLNLRRNPELHLRFRGFRPDGAIIRRIYTVGFPAIVMNSISSVVTFAINQILLLFSSTAIAVYGVYFKLQSFVFMPVFGLNNGMIPIIAYNYGAKNRDRIVHTLKLSWIVACSLMAAGAAAFLLVPRQLLGMFDASEQMLAIGVPALRIIATHFVLAGFSIVSGATFQALGNGMMTLIVTIARQVVVLLPAAYLLSLTGSLDLVWLSFPIAEGMSLLMTLIFLRRVFKTMINPLAASASSPEKQS